MLENVGQNVPKLFLFYILWNFMHNLGCLNEIEGSQQQGTLVHFGAKIELASFSCIKKHFRTVLTPFDHQITIKSWNKQDYIIFAMVLSPKFDVYASKSLTP